MNENRELYDRIASRTTIDSVHQAELDKATALLLCSSYFS